MNSEVPQETHLELLNFIHLITQYIHGTPLGDFLHRFENIIFTYLVIGFLGTLAYLASRNAKLVPGRLQSAFESVVSGDRKSTRLNSSH